MAGSFFATTGTEDLANLQTQEEIQESSENRPSSRWLRAGFWACIVISVAVVLRRIVALAHPPHSAPPQLAALDAVFASHATLTLAHILPALAFVGVAPFFVLSPHAGRAWPERLLFPLGAVVGITAYAMSVYSVGGWLERSAVLFFNTLFVVLVVLGVPAYETGRVASEATMDDPGNCDPSWHCDHPSSDGNLLCHQPPDTSPA
jgi:hypothetical protein